MAKLIFISPYIKGSSNSGKVSNLVNYIATREGVQLSPSPDKRENFVDYIANRPGVKRVSSHGLWDGEGQVPIMKRVVDEVSAHEGNIWTPVISLPRQDAERLGYDNVDSWRHLICSLQNDIAEAYKIKPDNLKWYAALHEKEKHIHVHMIIFSSDPNEGYLTKQGIANLKSSLVRQIYKDELLNIYNEQTQRRDSLQENAKELMRDLIGQTEQGDFGNPKLEVFGCNRGAPTIEDAHFHPICADVSKQADIDAAKEEVLKITDKLDAIINIAGIMLMGPVVEIPGDRMQQIMNINLIGMNTKATADTIKAEKPDAVIVAIGSSAVIPPIPGADKKNVLNARDVMAGTEIPVGKTVIVGGGLVGIECAEYLAVRGHSVTIIEMRDEALTELDEMRKIGTRLAMEKEDITIQLNAKCKEVLDGKVIVDVLGEEKEFDADNVLMAVGARPRSSEELIAACDELGIPYYVVGDAKKAGFALDAVYDAFHACFDIQDKEANA